MGFWFALEACTPDNGALWFLPSSHLTTPITKRFVRMPEGGTGFEPVVVPEKPLGLPDSVDNAPSNREYVLETCGAGA